jgi:hypothetical protein
MTTEEEKNYYCMSKDITCQSCPMYSKCLLDNLNED